MSDLLNEVKNSCQEEVQLLKEKGELARKIQEVDSRLAVVRKNNEAFIHVLGITEAEKLGNFLKKNQHNMKDLISNLPKEIESVYVAPKEVTVANLANTGTVNMQNMEVKTISAAKKKGK